MTAVYKIRRKKPAAAKGTKEKLLYSHLQILNSHCCIRLTPGRCFEHSCPKIQWPTAMARTATDHHRYSGSSRPGAFCCSTFALEINIITGTQDPALSNLPAHAQHQQRPLSG